jgi:glucose/arabinose dehydrogenase
MSTARSLLVLAVAASCSSLAFAQREVPFTRGIPVAPSGLADKPLGDGPFDYATAEGQNIRVTVLTKALSFPFTLTFLPDGTMLIAQRDGKLRVMRGGKLDPNAVAGGPASFFTGTSGLPGAVHGYMDIALHPQFEQNQTLYLSYTKPLPDSRTAFAVTRARWTGSALADAEDIFVAEPGVGGPTPIAFGRDGMLYIATSGGNAQDTTSLAGKVLRVRDDGSVPSDNPFAGREGYRPEIYTLGHRNSLGLALHPVTCEIWQSENGPNGGDELNIIRAGKNYGWPLVSLGRTYPGPWQAKSSPTHEGFEPPAVYWTPAIAVSGFTFYTGDRLAGWKGDMFIGGLRTGEIPGTGKLDRILFNQQMEELRRESLLVDLRQRIRDVQQGPDGLLYAITDEDEGAVLRIEPR